MQDGSIWVTVIDSAARETTLFAAVWFLIGGLDDLAVDFLYFVRRVRRWLLRTAPPRGLRDVPPAAARIAVFVPAWDEAGVIGSMLRATLARFGAGDYRLYVGTYCNDPATIAGVAEVAADDPRVRLVIGTTPGPTTKADCLNTLWRALRADEAREGDVAAVLLHDAEDLVHPGELAVIADALGGCDAVQLPVLPLPHPRSRLVAGHYCDEFAEAHGKQLPVREALGAGMPLAGVGCAIARPMLGRIAAARGGDPFDATSLTEDYELGLTIASMGGHTRLVRMPERPGGLPVAVRAYFPARLGAAVRQKARWMTGIALAGWDRTGWGAPRAFGDHWMRMRDRRATLAIPVLASAYCALVAWGVSAGAHQLSGTAAPPPDATTRAMLLTTGVLLAWRLAVRAMFVGRCYGWSEALWSVPRVLVGNLIALLAARRAAFLYIGILAGGAPKWDKTRHEFPESLGTGGAA